MSSKTFCDKCGRECDHTYSVTLRNFDWQECNVSKSKLHFLSCSPEQHKDLCGYCFGALQQWMEK